MTRRKRTLALLAAVLCLLTSVAQAAGSIDLTRKPTLTLTYRDGKTALSGGNSGKKRRTFRADACRN